MQEQLLIKKNKNWTLQILNFHTLFTFYITIKCNIDLFESQINLTSLFSFGYYPRNHIFFSILNVILFHEC